MMDFVMLGALVLGGAFLWVNKDNLPCMFNPNDPSCGGITGPDCTVTPDAVGCGGGGGSGSGNTSCGKLCRDKKCSEYKQNCSQGCTYCCDSGPQSPKCSGTPGSQCGALCQNSLKCAAQWNQCASDCKYCPWLSAAESIRISARGSAPAYTVECGRYGGTAGVGGSLGVRCRVCRKCSGGQNYCGGRILIAAKSATQVVSEMIASWQRAHPSGCPGGCTKVCGGGYILDKGTCTCNCNTTVKKCTASNQCLIKTDSACNCINTGSQGGCASGYHRVRGSGGLCGCAKNTSSGGSGCPGSMYTNCTWDCNGKYCWKSKCGGITVTYCTGSGNTAWSRSYGCSQAQKNFLARCAAYTRAIIPEEPYPRVAGSYAGQAGPFGDYRYVQTMRLPPPMFAGRTRR